MSKKEMTYQKIPRLASKHEHTRAYPGSYKKSMLLETK